MPLAPPRLLKQGVEYREVPGRPDYFVGDDGSVWTSRKRNGWPSNDWRPVGLRNDHGYLVVGFYKSENPGSEKVHAIVLRAFVGERPSGYHICHKNGIRNDNRLSNLYYGTPHDNARDKIMHGTQPRGESHGMAKLTASDVQEIVSLLDDYEPHEVAKMYGVKPAAIKSIERGENWAWLTGRNRETARSKIVAPCKRGKSRSRKYPQAIRDHLASVLIDGQCQSCGRFASRHVPEYCDSALEIDHKDPRGGTSTVNLHWLCRKCNRLKRDFVSPDLVIGQWVEDSPRQIEERCQLIELMSRNPGWSL